MSPHDVVDVVTPRQIKRTIRGHLKDLGLSVEELRDQAKTGRFESEKARALWLAIERFGQKA